MSTLIGITTFKKNDIAEDLLNSLHTYGYTQDNTIILADDSPGEALSVFKNTSYVEAYLTGNRHGIWANKNRIIRYFLNDSDCDYLLLLDNDIVFTAPGCLDELENASKETDPRTVNQIGHQHITGYVVDADGNDGLQKTFPYEGETNYLKFHPGCHGCFLWFTRENLKKVGYMRRYSYFYGGEHSELSNRCLMAQNKAPEYWYPVLKRSTKFFKLNPRDRHVYDVDLEQVYAKNLEEMHKFNADTRRGVNILNSNTGLDKELTVRRGDVITEEQIIARLSPTKKLTRSQRKK